jgi:hypothetical protein
MNVILAPTWRAAGARTLMLAMGLAVVAGGMYLIDGPPMSSRAVHQNEIARFTPAVGRGLTQFLGETALLVFATGVARLGLKIRL